MNFWFSVIDKARRLEDRAIDVIQARIDGLEAAIASLGKTLADLDARLQAYQDRR